MARRTKEEALKTRAEIMRAAEELFYEHGVTQTSLHKIALKAGVTRGAIYWHFRDKVDVLHAIADENFLPNEELLEHLSFQELDNPIEALRETSMQSIDEIVHDPMRRRVFTILTQRCEYVEEMNALAARHTECTVSMHKRLDRLFTQAKEKGKLAKCWEPKVAAYTLQRLFHGIVEEEMEHPVPNPQRDELRHSALNAFYNSLSA